MELLRGCTYVTSDQKTPLISFKYAALSTNIRDFRTSFERTDLGVVDMPELGSTAFVKTQRIAWGPCTAGFPVQGAAKTGVVEINYGETPGDCRSMIVTIVDTLLR